MLLLYINMFDDIILRVNLFFPPEIMICIELMANGDLRCYLGTVDSPK